MINIVRIYRVGGGRLKLVRSVCYDTALAQRRRREDEGEQFLRRQRAHLPGTGVARRSVRGRRGEMGSHDVRRSAAGARERAQPPRPGVYD